MRDPVRVATHGEMIPELLPLSGRRVIEVGCGDGTLCRLMTGKGAHVSGVECSDAALARARAAPPAGDERYIHGTGQSLPLGDGTADIVLYVHSFHHVPEGEQSAALAEARRVLVPGGTLAIFEPLAEGRYFELVRAVEDETSVRAHAYAVIREAAAHGWSPRAELFYEVPLAFPDFESFRARLIAADESRRSAVEAMEAGLRAGFERLADREAGRYEFRQPVRANLLASEARS